MKRNHVKFLVGLCIILFSFSACKKESEHGVSVHFLTKLTNKQSAIQKVPATNTLTVESFEINIKEIEFEYDENDALYVENDSTYYDDIELKGPFEIDLMKGGKTQVQTIINSANIPIALYDEIEFEFCKSKDTKSTIFGKSIVIKGLINNVPFIYSTDQEIELEIEFQNGLAIDGIADTHVFVSFDMDELFDVSKGGVDLTSAVDGNGDGKIEIFAQDPDGNEQIAASIWMRLNQIVDAYDD